MGAFTCIKPATFKGKKYMPGDIVPAEAIPADRVGAVISLGLVTQQAGGVDHNDHVPATISIPVKTDGIEEQLEATPEQIVEAITVLQMNVDAATSHIAGMADDTALHLIYVCDSRKTVKKAATDRAAEIGDTQEEPPETDVGAQETAQEGGDGEEGQEPGTDENAPQGAQGGQEDGE